MLALQRHRQRGAAAHRVADVLDGAARDFVLGQFQQDRQRAVQRLAGAEQGRQLLGELHQPRAREGFGLEQAAPRQLAARGGEHRLDRQMPLLLQAQHDFGVAGGLHLAVQHFAAAVQGFVAVEGHGNRAVGSAERKQWPRAIADERGSISATGRDWEPPAARRFPGRRHMAFTSPSG